jgi:hypothetical protein
LKKYRQFSSLREQRCGLLEQIAVYRGHEGEGFYPENGSIGFFVMELGAAPPGPGSGELSREAAGRICENFTLHGLYGLARIQKANAALHECQYSNVAVATFRAGVRFKGSAPRGCEGIAESAERLCTKAGAIAQRSVEGFTARDHREVATEIAAFARNIREERERPSSTLQAISQKLLRTAEQAEYFVSSRHTSIVERFWPEIVNQLLEEVALVQYAQKAVLLGSEVRVNTHGTFLGPVELLATQVTVDREQELRGVILQKSRAALAIFADNVRQWEESPAVPLELIRSTRAAFKEFSTCLTDGSASPQGMGTTRSGMCNDHQFLTEVSCALLDPAIASFPQSELSKKIVRQALRICNLEMAWAEWNVPFVRGTSISQQREVADRTTGSFLRDSFVAFDSAPVAPSRYHWELNILRRFDVSGTVGSLLKPADEGALSMPRRDRFRLSDQINLLSYGEEVAIERQSRFLPSTPSLEIALCGGSPRLTPSDARLKEYEEFQKQFQVNLQQDTPQKGLGGYYSADWLKNAFLHNGLVAIEVRHHGKLLGLYLNASDDESLTPLGQAIADTLKKDAQDDWPSTKASFSELVVGPRSKAVQQDFGVEISTTLHEVGESAVRASNGPTPVILFGVYRTKPALNTARDSHFRHGWSEQGSTYRNDHGTEYAVVYKPLPAASQYEFDGTLGDLRIPDLSTLRVAAVDPELVRDIGQTQERGIASKIREAESSRTAPPDPALVSYSRPDQLYRNLILSPIDSKGRIRAWEVYPAEEIATQLLAVIGRELSGSERSSWIERKIVASPIGTFFQRAFPNRFELAERAIKVEELATNCEKWARRAAHMGAQSSHAWLSHDGYTRKPREVAGLLRASL